MKSDLAIYQLQISEEAQAETQMIFQHLVANSCNSKNDSEEAIRSYRILVCVTGTNIIVTVLCSWLHLLHYNNMTTPVMINSIN